MKNLKCTSSFMFRFSVLTAMVMFILLAGASNSFADELVRKAQQAMLNKGFNAGPVDGIWGARTQRGVFAFQENENLEVTGQLDAATKRLLFSSDEAAPSRDRSSDDYDYSQWAPDADDSEIAEDPTQ